jgi:hypothetical protein
VLRKGERLELEVKIAELPEDEQIAGVGAGAGPG